MKVRKKELVVINHKSTDYDPKNHNIMQDNAIKNIELTGKMGVGAQHSKISSATHLKKNRNLIKMVALFYTC